MPTTCPALCQKLKSKDEQDADQIPRSAKCNEIEGSRGKKCRPRVINTHTNVVEAERREQLPQVLKRMEAFARL